MTLHTKTAAAVFAVLAAFVCRAEAAELSPELRRQFAEVKLQFCFQGKGSCLPYDAGILDEAYRRIPALRENRVVIAGNSSGSIAAGFFSCFGFTDDNVAYAVERLRNGDRTVVRDMENPRSKFVKMLRGQRTEIGHENLREYMGFALGVSDWRNYPTIEAIAARSQAVPRFPLLIVSCNKEVLEDNNDADGRNSVRFKEIDPATMIVSWRPEVYEFYKAHPDRFAAEHPQLKLGPDRRIGRAVTFFVDRSMYALLSQLPPEERTADLRLVETAAESRWRSRRACRNRRTLIRFLSRILREFSSAPNAARWGTFARARTTAATSWLCLRKTSAACCRAFVRSAPVSGTSICCALGRRRMAFGRYGAGGATL
ncbi:MAG: hypothetical protein QM775_35895 [Pirellulales bacterium]